MRRILKRREVEEITGFSRSTIYDKLNYSSTRYDESFPKSIKLGSRAVGWVASELEAWLESKIKASRKN